MTPIHYDSCSKPETTGTKQFRPSTNAASIQSSCNIKQQTNPHGNPGTDYHQTPSGGRIAVVQWPPRVRGLHLAVPQHGLRGVYFRSWQRASNGEVRIAFRFSHVGINLAASEQFWSFPSSVKREQYGDRILRLGSIHLQSIYSRTLNGWKLVEAYFHNDVQTKTAGCPPLIWHN